MAEGAGFLSLPSRIFPSSQSLQTQLQVPLGLTVHPLALSTLPIASYSTHSVVRCQGCQGYISPFSVFKQDGRVWLCALCSAVNSVPDYFYSPLEASGMREDAKTRTELSHMEYDILAPEEYMQRPPMPPTYCLVLDVSQTARVCGMTEAVCDVMDTIVGNQALPGLPRTQIAVILYGHEVHLVGFQGENGPIRLYSISKAADELFLPAPVDELLVSVEGNEESIKKCTDVIRKMNTESCLESSALHLALSYAQLILATSGGKLLVFLGESNPQDSHQYSTEIMVNSQTKYYQQKAFELANCCVAVDLFIAASRYCCLYALGDLAKYTSGKVYFYPELKCGQSGKLRSELWTELTQETVWEAKFRLRVSRDWKVGLCYGHFIPYDATMQALPALDATQTLSFDLSLGVTLASSAFIHVQAAMLYTTSDGDRRIRVLNGRFNLSHSLKEIYLSTDSETIAALWAKRALYHMISSNRFETGQAYIKQQISALFSTYLQVRTAEERDPLAFLPALTLGYLKLPLFNGLVSGCKGYLDHLDFDGACWQRYLIATFSPRSLSLIAYPRLYPLHSLSSAEDMSPLPLAKASLDPTGVYLLDAGWDMQIWIGKQVLRDMRLPRTSSTASSARPTSTAFLSPPKPTSPQPQESPPNPSKASSKVCVFPSVCTNC